MNIKSQTNSLERRLAEIENVAVGIDELGKILAEANSLYIHVLYPSTIMEHVKGSCYQTKGEKKLDIDGVR